MLGAPQLDRVLFPIGAMTKDDVRDLWELQGQAELYKSGAIRKYVEP